MVRDDDATAERTDTPKDQAIESIRNGINSFRAAVGHAEDYVTNYTDRLPFSLRALLGVVVGILLNRMYDHIAEILSAFLTTITGVITGFSIEITIVKIILWIFYLVLLDIGLTVVGFNGIARQLSRMEDHAARSDGGGPVDQRLVPKWMWLFLVLVHALFGAYIGYSFGTLGLFVGFMLGLVIGDELYRKLRDGKLLGF